MTKTRNYNDLNEELATILSQLQATDVGIDESLKLYERGLEISKQLEDYLSTAKNKITKLSQSFDA